MSRYNVNSVLHAVGEQLHTVDDIAEQLGCARSTVTKYVQRAELCGLLTLTRVAKLDVIELTDAGKQRIAS